MQSELNGPVQVIQLWLQEGHRKFSPSSKYPSLQIHFPLLILLRSAKLQVRHSFSVGPEQVLQIGLQRIVVT